MNTWSDNSNSITRDQESNALFLPISSSSSSSESSSSSSSSESSDDDDDDDDDEDDEDERNILRVLHEAQQQRLVNSSPLRTSTESASNI